MNSGEAHRNRCEGADEIHREAELGLDQPQHDIDVDVLPAARRERSADERQQDGQASRHPAQATEEGQNRALLQPVQDVAEVLDAGLSPVGCENHPDDHGHRGQAVADRLTHSAARGDANQHAEHAAAEQRTKHRTR